ncbi:proteasome subunit alpha [Actinomycetospora sp. CA-101289]|uniref:proteasome subunit alpha n=1 Tax=Actinomycetospora sp. CA-101289 TaxID=3239893 RepID=UPI003D97219D
MTMPFYASVDQLMRDRSELARKGIARGRSVVVLTCADGVLFVAENRSNSLRKVSEIYDSLGFAAVGRYNEFENLRTAGIRYADVRGYSYDRRDVTGRSLANAYAQILGASFIEQQKPFEVELCVAEVGPTPDRDQMFRITYDGSISDEPRFVVMGGTTEPISAALRESYEPDLATRDALRIALEALQAQNGTGTSASGSAAATSASDDRRLGVDALEVALLDRARRPRRAFRRITGAALSALMPGDEPAAEETEEAAADDTGAGDEVSGAGGADPQA